MKSRSVWFENGTEKARKQRNENSKRLIKSAILGNADIFVVRKSYNRQKAQDIAYLVLFCYYIKSNKSATFCNMNTLTYIAKFVTI